MKEPQLHALFLDEFKIKNLIKHKVTFINLVELTVTFIGAKNVTVPPVTDARHFSEPLLFFFWTQVGQEERVKILL